MKIYTVAGHLIDFVNEEYILFETLVYLSAEKAEEAAQEMIEDQLFFSSSHCTSRVDDLPVGDNGFDHDVSISDNEGRVFELKIRMLEI